MDVRCSFAKKAATRLKDMVYKLSRVKDSTILSWCPPLVHQQLKQLRESEEFEKKLEIYSVNRNSGEYGCSLHAQGSISTPEVMRRMVKELGRPLTISKVFTKSHHNKDDKFVDRRSASIWEKYESIKNSSETQEETSVGDDQVFFQAAGGWTQKGTVYGLGSGAHLFYERSISTTHSNSSVRPFKVRNLELKVEELETKKLQMKAQMEEQNRMILALKNAMEALGI